MVFFNNGVTIAYLKLVDIQLSVSMNDQFNIFVMNGDISPAITLKKTEWEADQEVTAYSAKSQWIDAPLLSWLDGNYTAEHHLSL